MRNLATMILPLVLAPLVCAQDIPLSQIIPEKSNWSQVRQIDKKVLAVAGNPDGSILVALENEVDYVVFIDDDVLLPTDIDSLGRLKSANKHIIAGWTVIRGYPYNNMFFKSNEKGGLEYL